VGIFRVGFGTRVVNLVKKRGRQNVPPSFQQNELDLDRPKLDQSETGCTEAAGLDVD